MWSWTEIKSVKHKSFNYFRTKHQLMFKHSHTLFFFEQKLLLIVYLYTQDFLNSGHAGNFLNRIRFAGNFYQAAF